MDDPPEECELIESTDLAGKPILAQGGSSHIFKATLKNSRNVALKVARSRLSHEKMRDEYHRQKALCEGHDHILRVLGCVKLLNEPDVTSGMLVELMDGSLTQVISGFLEKKQFPIEQCLYDYRHILHWMSQICSALEFIHQQGFVHRDIKPDNILLGDQWMTAKIGDFGITRPTADSTWRVEGTTRWMAPIVSDGNKFDPKDDVYSMGNILWQLVVRKKPFDEFHDVGMIPKLLEDGRRPRYRTFCLQFADILKNCWRPSREKRWSSRDLYRTIESYRSRVPQEIPPPTIMEYSMLIPPPGTSRQDGAQWMPTGLTPCSVTFSRDSNESSSHELGLDEGYEIVRDDDSLLDETETQTITHSPLETFLVEHVLNAQGFGLAGYLLGPGNSIPNRSEAISSFSTKIQEPREDSVIFGATDFFSFEHARLNDLESFAENCPVIMPSSFQNFLRQIINIEPPQGLAGQLNSEIVEPIRVCTTKIVEFLHAPSEVTFAKFEQKILGDQIDRIVEEFPKVFEEHWKRLLEWSDQNPNQVDHENYVKLWRLLCKAFEMANAMKFFYMGSKCCGDPQRFSHLIDNFKRLRKQVESLDKKYRLELGYLDFRYNAIPEFDRDVTVLESDKICKKLGDKQWSDTDELVNHYWVVVCATEFFRPSIDERYTYICEKHKNTGSFYILHRRSYDLPHDPPSMKDLWSNWHGENMKTIDFAVRDECTAIDVIGMSHQDVVNKCHEKALVAASQAKSVITTGRTDRIGFCSYGTHPNAAGRVIRMFGRISIFVGF